MLDNVLYSTVHLFFDSICSFSNVVDGFGVDAALCNKLVSLHLEDSPTLYFFLECKVIPVVGCL
jgi:hypothetical protein